MRNKLSITNQKKKIVKFFQLHYYFINFISWKWTRLFFETWTWINIQWCRNRGGAGGGARGPLTPPPIFRKSVNPIPTGEGQIIPTYYYCRPIFFTFRHHCIQQVLWHRAQIREQMSGPDLHVFTLKFLALKKTCFSPIKNTFQNSFDFCLPLFYATFQRGP